MQCFKGRAIALSLLLLAVMLVVALAVPAFAGKAVTQEICFKGNSNTAINGNGQAVLNSETERLRFTANWVCDNFNKNNAGYGAVGQLTLGHVTTAQGMASGETLDPAISGLQIAFKIGNGNQMNTQVPGIHQGSLGNRYSCNAAALDIGGFKVQVTLNCNVVQ